MSKYVIDSETLTDIADAIREKTGKSALMTPLEMPGEVRSISGGGGYAPSGYTRLKYLQATGTQYIDTGKYLKLNSEFYIDARYSDGAQGYYAFPIGSQNPICGIAVINSISYPNNFNPYVSFGSNVDQKGLGNAPYWSRFVSTLSSTQYTTTIMTEEAAHTQTAALSGTTVTEDQTSHIGLFARGNRGTFERFFKGYIYEYKYSESGVLLQDMIPVKRNSDDELGMYDLVNDVFYTNDGTGDFIGGAWE